jgi:valyl-tRNA synthetase
VAEGLVDVLRIVHPLMPFVTEQIWDSLAPVVPAVADGEPLLIRAPWPTPGARDLESEQAFNDLSALVRAVRNLRTQSGVPAGSWTPVAIGASDARAIEALETGRRYIEALARARPITIRTDGERPPAAVATPMGAAWLEIESASEAAAERRGARVDELDRNIARLRELLANNGFTSKAPPEVVNNERKRLSDLEEQRRQLADD